MFRERFLGTGAILLILLCFVGGSQGSEKMKKVVMIVAQNGFRDEELLQPKKILESSGIAVIIASQSESEAIGMLGARVKPEIKVKDVDMQNFDAVVFVGGSGASIYWDNPVAHKIAQEAYSSHKPVAAICIAPVILAKAGLLKDKKATVWASEADILESEGAIYTGAAVEVDGNIITASGPSAAEAFAKEIVRRLSE